MREEGAQSGQHGQRPRPTVYTQSSLSLSLALDSQADLLLSLILSAAKAHDAVGDLITLS